MPQLYPELGGHVPLRNERLETTVKNIFVAGDAGAVEEASSAMVEGSIAGLGAAYNLGYGKESYCDKLAEASDELDDLRRGPTGKKILFGLNKLEKLKEAPSCLP